MKTQKNKYCSLKQCKKKKREKGGEGSIGKIGKRKNDISGCCTNSTVIDCRFAIIRSKGKKSRIKEVIF